MHQHCISTLHQGCDIHHHRNLRLFQYCMFGLYLQ